MSFSISDVNTANSPYLGFSKNNFLTNQNIEYRKIKIILKGIEIRQMGDDMNFRI